MFILILIGTIKFAITEPANARVISYLTHVGVSPCRSGMPMMQQHP